MFLDVLEVLDSCRGVRPCSSALRVMQLRCPSLTPPGLAMRRTGALSSSIRPSWISSMARAGFAPGRRSARSASTVNCAALSQAFEPKSCSTAPADDLDVEAGFDLPQVFIERPAQVREQGVVDRCEISTFSTDGTSKTLGPDAQCRPVGLVALHRFADHNFASQAVRPARACDAEASSRRSLSDQAIGLPTKLTTRLLSVRPASSVGILSRQAFDQHALDAADHGLADHLRLLASIPLLQRGSGAPSLTSGGVLSSSSSRRRTGTRAVDEGERGVETDLVDQLHRLFEVLLGFAGEADDEIRRQRDVGPRLARSLRMIDLYSSAV